MIKTNIKVPFYNVTITLVSIESKNDAEELKNLLKHTFLEEKDIERSYNIVKGDYVNGGDTYRNLDKRSIVCIIYRCTTFKVFCNIVGHEKRHIEDRILEYFSVNDIESSGLLAGFLTEKIFNKLLKNYNYGRD